MQSWPSGCRSGSAELDASWRAHQTRWLGGGALRAPGPLSYGDKCASGLVTLHSWPQQQDEEGVQWWGCVGEGGDADGGDVVLAWALTGSVTWEDCLYLSEPQVSFGFYLPDFLPDCTSPWTGQWLRGPRCPLACSGPCTPGKGEGGAMREGKTSPIAP